MLQIEFTGFGQQLLLKQKPFCAKIYEGKADPPAGFNGVSLSLDASLHSLLNWEKQILLAQRYIDAGMVILWELQFSFSEKIFEDEAHFLTFQLAIQHFNETIWQKFHYQSLGVALYRGELNVQNRDPIVSYIKLLAALLPEEVSCFLFLDTTAASDAKSYFRSISQEAFGHLHLILKGPFAEKYPYGHPALAWGHTCSPLGFCSPTLGPIIEPTKVSYALCLPKDSYEEVQVAIDALGSIPFRVIPEDLLIYEWEGVDRLVIFPHALSSQGWRKVAGFIAAGGEIINFPDDAASLPLQGISPPSSPVFSP
jgi:hypothetical protein